MSAPLGCVHAQTCCCLYQRIAAGPPLSTAATRMAFNAVHHNRNTVYKLLQVADPAHPLKDAVLSMLLMAVLLSQPAVMDCLCYQQTVAGLPSRM